MLIAIDASRAVNEKAGIGRYTRELVKKLIEIDKKNDYLLLFSYWRKDRGKERLIREFQAPNVELKTFKLPGPLKEKLWGWRLSWLERVLEKVDLFYAPSFWEVNLGLQIPQVMTIYDLTTFLFPEHLGQTLSERMNQRTRLASRKVQRIITISEHTKNDLIEIIKVPEQKVKVIYPGRTDFHSVSKSLPSGLKKNAFILSVGTIEPRKNLEGLFKAYALLPPNLQEKYPLAVVGAEGWQTAKIFNTFNRLNLGGKVKFLGYVSDEVLARLYREAAVFCYPSLYEGFGFPVLEALSFGTPAVISRTSSLPEVAGRGALYVDPQDPKLISGGLERLLEHKEEAEGLRKLALIEAQKFSWEKTAHETLKVFERIERK